MNYRATFALLAAIAGPSLAAETDATKYELASVIKGLLISKDGRGLDYLDTKRYVNNVRAITSKEANAGPGYFPGEFFRYSKVYRGEMPLYVGGKRFLAANMEDQYAWIVYIAGPAAIPTSLYIKGDSVAANLAGGPGYFRKAGLDLMPITCDRSGGSNANYSGVYLVSAPGKLPAVLQIDKSTGSGGTWYSYGLHWGGLLARDLPADAALGECEIKD